MNLGSAKTRAIQYMREYSNNGSLISTSANADYLLAMNGYADAAQKEIATKKKIPGEYSIAKLYIPSMLGKIPNTQKFNTDVVYEMDGARSYYFEVDNPATVYIEESVSGVWQTLETINNIVKGKFTAYKNNILPTVGGSVRLRFSGSTPYSIRNVALYQYSFASSSDIPSYSAYVKYPMPGDCMEIKQVLDDNTLTVVDYQWQNKTLLLEREYSGQVTVLYNRYPTTITQSTLDSYEFEVEIDAQELIPFYMAGHALLDENPDIAGQLLGEYQNKLNNLRTKFAGSITEIQDTNGW